MQQSGDRARFGRRSKWILLLISLLFAMGGAELAMRCCWHNPYRHDGLDRVVRLRLQHANTCHRIDRSAIHPEKPTTLLRTDSRSYVLPSFQFKDPDHTISFLGGSTTECCAVDEPLRFPALVSSLLAEHGLKVNTLNAATSGNTLHDSINNLFNHVIQDEPDIVVLMHACNDIGVLARGDEYRSRAGQFAGWPVVLRSSLMNLTNHSYLMAVTRQVLKEHTHFVPTAPEDIVATHACVTSKRLDGAYEKRLRVFIRMCLALGAKPVLMTQPTSGHFNELSPDWMDESVQSRFNEIVRRVGAEEGALVIDLVRHLEDEVPNWDDHLNVFYDGVHVTDKGSRIYGEYIAARLLTWVRDASAGGVITKTSLSRNEQTPLIDDSAHDEFCAR